MRRRWKTLLPLAAVLAVCGALPSLAVAQQVAPFTFETSFDGAESTTGPLGGEMRGVMVNDQTGNVLVLTTSSGSNRLVVDQFNAKGEPVSFTSPSLHGSSSLVLPPQNGNFIEGGPTFTVDNSGGPTQGRIYIDVGVAVGRSNGVLAYNPDGSPVGGNYPQEVYEPSGAAVDPDTSELLVNEYREVIERFTPEGARTKQKFRFGSGAYWGTQLAVDSEGNIYLSGRQGITKYSRSGQLLYILESNPFGTIQFNTSIAIDPATDDVFVSSEKEGTGRVTEFNKRGTKLATIVGPGIGKPAGIAFDPINGKLYVADAAAERVDIFTPGTAITLPEVTGGIGADFESTSVTLNGFVDPAGVPTIECFFEWGTEIEESYGPEKPYEGAPIACSQGQVLTGTGEREVTAPLTGLTQGAHYHFRLVVRNANGKVYSVDHAFSPSAKATVSNTYVTEVHSDTAELHASVNPGGAAATYHFEYGTSPCTAGGCTVLPSFSAGGGVTSVAEAEVIRGLTSATTYYYRLVAQSQSGVVDGLERTFTTFPALVIPTGCANEHVRQQTGSALLLDCRAYELVSAVNSGGYDVESTLVTGQTPFESYPDALSPSRVLYGTYGGGIPNVGSPTNHGIDPYVATRTESGWVTSYVGIPADDPITESGGPFGSTLLEGNSDLGTLAFGGPEICDPCFADGSSGIPVRLADGRLVQGMAGSIPQPGAEPAGHIGQSLSTDGDHLVFGSTSQFEPAGNNNGDVTIYERDLGAAGTQVVSTLPSGATMTGAGIGELAVSADGSRVVVGQQVGVDGAGNPYWHLYEHVAGSNRSIDLTPGTTHGALFDGMSADGTKVFFTTADKLASSDTDPSADIYEASGGAPGGAATLRQVSLGNGTGCEPVEEWNVVAGGGETCDAVAIGGGGGVAADGNAIYFLSPELLAGAGEGVADLPNLYVSRNGSAPRFVATIDNAEGKAIDDPTVVDSVAEPETHHYASFQVTADGRYAAFPSPLELSGYESDDHSEVYRFDAEAGAGAALVCASCTPTNAKAAGNASLPSGGVGLIADGRVFFNSDDALAPRDLDGVLDAYEWEAGKIALISTGTSQTPSALLGVSSDGTDAYFFTREQLAPQDINGNHVKIYDARVEGGFAFTPEPVPCKASDECHGPSSEPAPSPPINTLGGTGGNAAPPAPAKKCAKGKVHSKGKCVAKHPKKKAHKKKAHKKATKSDRKQGGRQHG